MKRTKVVIVITPEMARNCLEKNPSNRKIIDFWVRLYAKMMQDGEWVEDSPENFLIFDENDNLIDGQHRLRAVILANVPIKFTVYRGWPRELILHLNQGKKRTFNDRARFLGKDERISDLTIAKIIKYGPGLARSKKLSPILEFELIEEYREGIEFAHSCGKHTKYYVIPIQALIARAAYTQNKIRLREFVGILVSGNAEKPGDSPAIKLRECVLQFRLSGKQIAYNPEFYYKAESSLRAFLTGKELKKLYRSTEELFKIPGEM